jgi:DEAD/DEAH box helicase domain-containing protein
MLPLQQAYEVRESVMEYLKATFRFKEKDVHDAFYKFLEDEKDGLFKGPYISLKTPFVKATPEEEEEIQVQKMVFNSLNDGAW